MTWRYVVVYPRQGRMECFHRTDAGWMLTEAGPGERLYLASIEGQFSIDALCRGALDTDEGVELSLGRVEAAAPPLPDAIAVVTHLHPIDAE